MANTEGCEIKPSAEVLRLRELDDACQARRADYEFECQQLERDLKRLERWRTTPVDHSGVWIPEGVLPASPLLRQAIKQAFEAMRAYGYFMIHADMSHQPAPDEAMDVTWASRCWLTYWLYELGVSCPYADPLVLYVGVLARPSGAYYMFTAPPFVERLRVPNTFYRVEYNDHRTDEELATALRVEYAIRANKYGPGRTPAQEVPATV